MQKQICLQYKNAMEECNNNLYVFVFKQIKIKNKICNAELELGLMSVEKIFK